ncbi:hypothetical protein LVY74_14975 [Acinetobacter sp. ME22]|uniref:hypothetical protein n=1 Tax=Acinetobacter sp. ME22 TaxID=2904802 RepID=UPI001EDB88B0|nr:hypothetical protein [Acinetobacter sp. ME22]MCG2574849.1 hypothetical protein [Acinetobacter sp. ME22]
MGKFGRYSEQVQEVINFVEQNFSLGTAGISNIHFPIHLLGDFDEAKNMAWRQEGQFLPWVDIRENEASEILAERYKLDDFKVFDDELGLLIDHFYSVLRKKLSGEYVDLLDDIASDLYNCAYARAIHGIDEEGLFEKIFITYRAGYWPCGWEGIYPDGNMLIYKL